VRRRIAMLSMTVTGALLLGVLAMAPARAVPAESSTGLKRPLDVTLKVSGWCDNTGSDINIVGDLTLGSVDMRVTLANNRKGTHSVGVDFAGDVNVAVAEENAVIQKAPAFGGVGGNPHAILELRDSDTGAVLTNTAGDPLVIYLGRCVSGANKGFAVDVNEQVDLDGLLEYFVQAVECGRYKSRLDIGANALHDGVDGHLILANQVNKVPGEPGVHYADVQADVTVNLLASTQSEGGKGWWDAKGSIHGPGGNPLVYVGADLDAWNAKQEATWGTFLGRCNKLT
jgi:hypothetical protein